MEAELSGRIPQWVQRALGQLVADTATNALKRHAESPAVRAQVRGACGDALGPWLG